MFSKIFKTEFVKNAKTFLIIMAVVLGVSIVTGLLSSLSSYISGLYDSAVPNPNFQGKAMPVIVTWLDIASAILTVFTFPAVYGGHAALAIVLSVVAGSLALVAMAFIMRGIMKMRSDGNIDIKRAVGKIADVYLTVPAKDNGNGKVTLTLEERFVELSAIQNGETPLTTGSKVKITDVSGDCVIVEKI